MIFAFSSIVGFSIVGLFFSVCWGFFQYCWIHQTCIVEFSEHLFCKYCVITFGPQLIFFTWPLVGAERRQQGD